MNSLVFLPLLILHTSNVAKAQKIISESEPLQTLQTFDRLGSDNKLLSSDVSLAMIDKLTAEAILNAQDKKRVANPISTGDSVHLGELHTYTRSKSGITLWDGSARIEITTENSNIPENNITALVLDKDQNLLIGTYGSGVVKGYGKSIKPFKIKPIITQELCVRSISADDQGLVWVLYQSGCFECFENDLSFAFFTPTPNVISRGIPRDP